MDRESILLNNYNVNVNIYNNIKKKMKEIKGIELGLKFLESLYANLKHLEALSYSSENENELKEVIIYDFNNKKDLKIKVNEKLFQHQLQFFYRQFIEDYYFMSFPWYNDFSKNIFNLLRYQFNYDNIESMKFIVRMISNTFVIYSNGNNEYNYINVMNHFKKVFCQLGLSLEESSDFSLKIMRNLEIYEFIFLKKNLIGNEVSFHLSDPYIDIVFFLNSLFLATIYDDGNGIKYNSYIDFEKLPETINSFKESIKKKIKELYPDDDDLKDIDFLKKVLDFSNLESKNIFMEFSPKNIKKLDLYFYFNNILLNEYCFHIVAMSCFKFYYIRPSLKNVLFFHKDYNFP